MTTPSKWKFGISAFLGVVIVMVIVGWLTLNAMIRKAKKPYLEERQKREAVIAPLLQSHATREQVTNALALDFTDFSIDSTNRAALAKAFHHPRVKEAATRYPQILFHTTADTMTWLFFDAEGRLQDYYLPRQ